MATVFTPSQLSAFYDRIRLPSAHRHLPGPELTSLLASPDASLALLAALQRHAIASLPFENLSLHYALNPGVHLDPTHLFDKVIGRRAGRGGWCMELNGLLLSALRGLGFDARGCGGKANSSLTENDQRTPRKDLTYSGWGHMVILVRVGEGTVLVDVGFGGGNPTQPIWLREGGQEVVNVPGSEDGEGKPHMLRLGREEVEGNQMWVLDRLVHAPDLPEDGEYRPFYAFTEMSFSHKDFEIMNHHVSTARDSFFSYVVFVVMSILSEDGERVVGDMVLFNNHVKKKMYGKLVEERELKSEKERIQVLEEWFGIKLNATEQAGIKGLVTALK